MGGAADQQTEVRCDALWVEFRREARQRLADPCLESAAAKAHFSKAAIVVGAFVVSYAAMLFASAGAAVVTAGILTGVAAAGLAFNVQHDGGHGAFADNKPLNAAAAGVLGFLGMSSYLWRWKHNLLHHDNPNVQGVDDDVDATPFLRLHPSQPWHPWQRYQHLYCWFLYSLTTLRWVFVSDFVEVRRGRIGQYQFPQMSPAARRVFWLSKGQFLVWALLVPVAVHGWMLGFGFFMAFEMTGGLIAGLCFQLAHAVVEADHFDSEDVSRIPWAELQLRSTVDFCTGPVVGWYLGGLNYQAIHHLLPGVRHTHYASLAPVLLAAAERHGSPYRRNPSLRHQLYSHFRLMRRLGGAASVLRIGRNGQAH